MSKRRLHWLWPLGIAAAGLGSAATLLFRGCWHRHMGWPMRLDDEYSYQVCTDCGIKRLYDGRAFRPYGPFSYDLRELVARDRKARMDRYKREHPSVA